MKVLELFKGTGSVGKVMERKGYEVISLDIMSKYNATHTDDIMTWDYKQYPNNYFDIITASPVCLYWSILRKTWIGRKCKTIHPTDIITKEHIQNDIDTKGKPMVDKTIEIIEYFKTGNPELKYWIENPQTGLMKKYIEEKYPHYNFYYDFDYCKYTDWGYKKKTRFWTNIKNVKPLKCNNDCNNIIQIDNQKLHKERMGSSKLIIDNGKYIRVNTKELRIKYKDYSDVSKNYGKGTNKDERYRIPEKIIEDLVNNIHIN